MASRYQNKAYIMTEAWKKVFGETPTKEQVIGAMLPAEVETALGDASEAKGDDPNQRTWRGEINWGALQKTIAQGGLLTNEERAVILANGGTLTPRNEDDVDKARKITASKGLRWIGMHRDSIYNSKTGANDPYLVFFWAFDNHIDAAAQYLRALKDMFIGEKATKSMGAMGTHELATIMYDGKYYGGFKPREGAIQDYSDRMSGAKGSISSALANWDPSNQEHDESALKSRIPFPTSPGEPEKGGAPFPVGTFRDSGDGTIPRGSFDEEKVTSKEGKTITRNIDSIVEEAEGSTTAKVSLGAALVVLASVITLIVSDCFK